MVKKKEFHDSYDFIRSVDTMSSSIVAKAMSPPRTRPDVEVMWPRLSSEYHSVEISRIPGNVKIEPIRNHDLRTSQTLSIITSVDPLIQAHEVCHGLLTFVYYQISSARRNSALDLYNSLNSVPAKSTRDGIGPREAPRRSLEEPAMMKSIKRDVLADVHAGGSDVDHIAYIHPPTKASANLPNYKYFSKEPVVRLADNDEDGVSRDLLDVLNFST